MNRCPICEDPIEAKLNFCPACGWDYDADPTRLPSLTNVTPEEKQVFESRMKIAKDNWSAAKQNIRKAPELLTQYDGLNKEYTLLCIDVGQSRIKFGIMKTGREHFYLMKSDIISNTGFAGQRRWEYFLDIVANFSRGIRTDGVALIVCGPVDYILRRHLFHERDWGFADWDGSLALYDNFLGSHGTLAVFNDGVGFSFNALHRLSKLPALCLTLGAGIGACLVNKANDKPIFQPLESFQHRSWPTTDCIGDLHGLAGNSFFEFVQQGTDWRLEEIKSEFSLRIAGIIQHFMAETGDISTVILGGGHASLIDIKVLKRDLGNKKLEIVVYDDIYALLFGAAFGWTLVRLPFQQVDNTLKTTERDMDNIEGNWIKPHIEF